MFNKNTKLVTHHFTERNFLSSEYLIKKPLKKIKIFTNLAVLFLQLFTNILYITGLLISYPFTFLLKDKSSSTALVTEKFKYKSKTINLKWEQIASRQFAVAIATFIFFAIGVSGFFHTAFLYAKGLQLKGEILGAATVAINNIRKGGSLLGSNEVVPAQHEFSMAISRFQETQDNIQNAGALLNNLTNLLPAKRDADNLLNAGKFLASAGIDFAKASGGVKKIKLTPLGLTTDPRDGITLKDIEQNIHSGVSSIESARELINKISLSSIPDDQQTLFINAKEMLNNSAQSLAVLDDLTKLLGALLEGHHEILLLFQNNNELRASGGFLGTYGELVMNNGKVIRLHVSSIYDLDGQLDVKGVHIIPPYPMFNVNDHWYMRDSNWFVNFPESAVAISRFYQKELGKTPDTIIALTPDIIIDLLKITGPISMPKYNITLDYDNFVELTQVETSIYYDKRANKPKQMLADFMNVLLQKITNLPQTSTPALLVALQENLEQKQILLYSTNSETEKQLNDFNWAGTVAPSEKDYLLISSSNLSGTKTDTYLETSMNLETNISATGSIINTVTITRKNPLPPQDQFTNLSFIRVLVPKGSTLINNRGFKYVDLDTKYSSLGEVDPQVVSWEKTSVKDLSTGTLIGLEAGKTFFANWLEVKGGESKTVTLMYRLPFTISNLERYSLILQKQPGVLPINFSYQINAPQRSLEWSSQPQLKAGDAIQINQKLDKDKFFGFVFNKQ